MRRKALITLAAACVASTALSAKAPPVQPVVVTSDGAVGGEVLADGVEAFLGIPYAAPPIGANRWRAPQPVARWTGTRPATSYGADCAQAPFPPDAAPIRTTPREDCLYLNVWRPAKASAAAKLPVMVAELLPRLIRGTTSRGTALF